MDPINSTNIHAPQAANAYPAGFTSLLASIPAPLYTCDLKGIITFFNPAAEKLWGKAPEPGTKWYKFLKLYKTDGSPLLPDDCPVVEVLSGASLTKQKEMIIERPDGVRRVIMLNVHPLLDTNGNMAGVTNMAEDVTDKKLEDALLHASENKYRSLSELLEKMVEERTFSLKKSEERYHKMIDEVQDYAIILLDRDGFIQNWNLGAEKIKGYTDEEIVGKNFRLFYQPNDRTDMLPERLITQAHDTGRAVHEGWRVRKDGSKFWGLVVITALHDDDGNIIGFSKVTRDLTERKIADDQMQEYAKEIEFRNKQLEEYAYIASHDLQEPLRKIQLFAEMLESSIGNEAMVKKNIEKINSAAKRMSNLIKDVLKYSQLSRADELFEEVDLNDVINTIREDFELPIAEKNVMLENTLLPTIKGIPIQLHQLFANMVSNAIKFSSQNPVITISHENVAPESLTAYPHLSASRPFVKVIVKDNGMGFEQQYGEQVFRMFKRLTDNSGTGIGLALCKKIVENHGGDISVISEPGLGTEFTILMPLA
ncbi:PAS domain-containing sensor histidine kinase [uncultured Flavobacterium sp.]|uniref:PAS domain-containing sensor histidine kinase n=1 Tax=uncultured Flavobacterium sp. TaxID=165435 RepID=UPI0025D46E7D|nr:PAS domain-containing sensor histidine kinase [uncultured Flavobacterium sp.]